MELEKMSRDERSLLLYIETCATDEAGLIDSRKVNEDDIEILKEWDETGFISYSRLTWNSIQKLSSHYHTSRVFLSEDAWKLAHEERRARNKRMSGKSPYKDLITTKTKNSTVYLDEE